MDNLLIYLHPFINAFVFFAKWFFICMWLFIPLACLFPGKSSQPLLRRDMLADSLYWFCDPFVYGPIFRLLAITLLSYVYAASTIKVIISHGLSPLADLNIYLQALLMLLISDFMQYWVHRLFHGAALWEFHAVHHSSPNVDWLSAARFHPINTLFYSTLINAIIYLLGFNPATYAILLPFNMIYASFLHANLKWTFGPFRYVLASPAFHRWHHTLPNEGGNKNFAPTFPIFDVMFGTFYMPKGIQPTVFGTIGDPIPTDFLGQLAYPFRKKINYLGKLFTSGFFE